MRLKCGDDNGAAPLQINRRRGCPIRGKNNKKFWTAIEPPKTLGYDTQVMKRYKIHTLQEYLEVLSQRTPVPGGGSAAALVGSLGAALISMVAN